MTDVTNAAAISNINTTNGTTENSALSGLTSDFENFLTLFLTQLQNQDPTEPLDTNQLTDQIVQFTQVEQQINSNTKLDSIIDAIAPNVTTEAVGFVDKFIEFEGDQVNMNGYGAEFAYQLNSSATDVEVVITDSAGNVVRTVDNLETTLGKKNSVLWDGTDEDGNKLEAGTYNIDVKAERDGEPVLVTTYVTDYVSSVDVDGGEIVLNFGDISVDASEITTIKSTSLLEQAILNAQQQAAAAADAESTESTEDADGAA